MILTLPSRSGAPALEINTSRLTVIGANGAGKTRFARALAASLGERAFAMSALRALYDREAPASPAPGSIDMATEGTSMPRLSGARRWCAPTVSASLTASRPCSWARPSALS